MMKNKKADGGLTAVVIIVIILVFLGWLMKVGYRECNGNKDCSDDEYCGSDFSCHKIPVIEKTPTVVNYDLKFPAIFIGISIVIAAIILRWEKIKPRIKKRKDKTLMDYPYYTPYKD